MASPIYKGKVLPFKIVEAFLEKYTSNLRTCEKYTSNLVDWDMVCSPISEGGLGIRNVRKFNQALLGKCLWWYAHKEDAW